MKYIDLNLPSGNLWADTNEEGFYTYDEAVEQYGDQLPTKEDWEELMNNTTAEWTTVNGVNGRRFTAANGNSIFLPAAGYSYDGSLDDAGDDGNYWSASLNETYPNSAWCFYFNSGSQYMGNDGRTHGQSVRLVRHAHHNLTPTTTNTTEDFYTYDEALEKYEKYKDALNKAKLLDPTSAEYDTAVDLFPELAEWDTKRVINNCRAFLNDYRDSVKGKWAVTECIMLLDNPALLNEQGEQKPAWSEEDEKGLAAAIWVVKNAVGNAKDENSMGDIYLAETWLKSLKQRFIVTNQQKGE